MTSKISSFIKSISLIIILIVVFILMILYIVAVPIARDRNEDDLILKEMANNNRLNSCKLISHFSSDQTYYVAQCIAHYYVYDNLGNLLYKAEVKEFNKNLVSFETDSFQLSLGYYQDHFVYVLKSNIKEVLIDYNSYEVLREYIY